MNKLEELKAKMATAQGAYDSAKNEYENEVERQISEKYIGRWFVKGMFGFEDSYYVYPKTLERVALDRYTLKCLCFINKKDTWAFYKNTEIVIDNLKICDCVLSEVDTKTVSEVFNDAYNNMWNAFGGAFSDGLTYNITSD